MTAIAVIYLRGYLVPGTPMLTKRYFPDQVLAWFDKEPTQTFHVYGDIKDVDAEDILRRADALEVCAGGDDLCLSPRFSEAWHQQVERLEIDAPERTLADLLDVPSARLTTQNRGRSFVATVDGNQVGQWESRAAFVADMTAERALSELTRGWNDVPVEQRSVLLRQLRVFLEWCPECGGAVRLAQKTRTSCCRSWAVIASACEGCDARLFEVKADEVEGVDG
ncbi:hypothetical protein [Halogranum amylolyticum]|uniref:hypothetical protein n=1 Tax=Halogranum amylolyticum TaxID=660520 RepID=UPI001FCD1900|nr:hypothetical protein [Halogranum amylolyticum]